MRITGFRTKGNWFYLTALPYFNPIGPPTGYFEYNGKVVCGCQRGDVFVPDPVTSNNPNVRPLGDAYFNDVTRVTGRRPRTRRSMSSCFLER